MNCGLPGSSVHGILQARILEWVTVPFPRGSPQPRYGTQVSCIAGRFFTIWATREAQEYWSGRLSCLQGIFPIQGSNQGLLHCRQILNQLSYQGIQEMNFMRFPWGGNLLVQIHPRGLPTAPNLPFCHYMMRFFRLLMIIIWGHKEPDTTEAT